jgi:hypothetical protein
LVPGSPGVANVGWGSRAAAHPDGRKLRREAPLIYVVICRAESKQGQDLQRFALENTIVGMRREFDTSRLSQPTLALVGKNGRQADRGGSGSSGGTLVKNPSFRRKPE